MISKFQKVVNFLYRRFVQEMGREPASPKEIMDIQNEAVRYFNRTKGAPEAPKKPNFQGFTPKVIEGGKKQEIDVEIWKKQKKAENKAAIERFKEKTKKTVEDFRDDGDFDPGGMAEGGIAPLIGEPSYSAQFYNDRIPYAGGGSAGLPAVTQGAQATHLNMQGPQMPVLAPQPTGIIGANLQQHQNNLMQQQIMQTPYSSHQQGKPYQGQFRMPFDKGGMSRRGFLKMMGGLSALPFIGKYLKGAKVAAPAVEAGIETIKRTAGGIPEYAYNLIEVVKNKGIMEIMEGIYKKNPASKKYTYKGVEVVEDGMGNTQVRKMHEGPATDAATGKTYDGVSREVGFDITKGEDIVKQGGKGDDAGKVLQGEDDYFEATVRPDSDGKLKDMEEFIDDVDHLDLKEIADEIYIKKSSGGIARMLGE